MKQPFKFIILFFLFCVGSVEAQTTRIWDGTDIALVTSGKALMTDASATTQPVSGTFWQATQPVSGTLTCNIGTISTLATAAKQDTGNTSLSSIDGKTPSLVSGRVPVDGSGVTQPVSGTFWQATQPISAASGQFASGSIASGAVASGAYASGSLASGSVSDGAIVTLGAKADAKSTSTDTTAITSMQVFKEISFMAQNPAALPANQSVNAAQINGVTPLMGNGASGTGALRVAQVNDGTGILASIGSITSAIVPGTAATNLGKAEDAASVGSDTGVASYGIRNDALASNVGSDGDYGPGAIDKANRQIFLPYAAPEAKVRGCASATGTGDTSTVAASGDAALKTYIVACQIANTGSATALITLKDGNAGSTLGTSIAPAGGGSNIVFPVELVTSANVALYFAAGTSSTTVYVCCQGYKAP